MVAQAFVRAIAYSGSETILNVGSSIGLSVRDVVESIYRACGADLSLIKFKPGRPADVPSNVLATDLISGEMDWRPVVGWDHGIVATIDWMRKLLSKAPSERSLT